LFVWLAIVLSPIPAGLHANRWNYLAVFAAVIAGLIFESMPVGAVGILGRTFVAVMDYVEPDPGKSIRWALAGFSEGTVWLIVGAYVFAVGYRKSGLGERIALLLVRLLGRKTLGLGYAVSSLTCCSARRHRRTRHAAVAPFSRSSSTFRKSMARRQVPPQERLVRM
jgi:citrate:succinate antiporter/L-tartrate/succinate antiporter